MSGFVAIYREVADHHLFVGDVQRLGAWTWLVAKACWRATKFNIGGVTVTVERGQLCASRSQLATAWGMSPSAVERFLTRLETEQMIGRATGQGRTIITICNYEKYQDGGGLAGQATGQATGQPSDSDRTAKEQGNKGTIVEEEPNGSPSTQRACAQDQSGSVESDKPAKAPRRKKAAPPLAAQPADVSEQVWGDFLSHRAKTGGDVSETVVATFRREADRVGWPLERAMTESILRGWRGFKADWIKDDERRNENGGRPAARGNYGGYGAAPDRRNGTTKAWQRRLESDATEGASASPRRYDDGEFGGSLLLPAPRGSTGF